MLSQKSDDIVVKWLSIRLVSDQKAVPNERYHDYRGLFINRSHISLYIMEQIFFINALTIQKIAFLGKNNNNMKTISVFIAK